MSVESNLYASYERHLIETYSKPKLLPCMLLTGFLGSGERSAEVELVFVGLPMDWCRKRC